MRAKVVVGLTKAGFQMPFFNPHLHGARYDEDNERCPCPPQLRCECGGQPDRHHANEYRITTEPEQAVRHKFRRIAFANPNAPRSLDFLDSQVNVSVSFVGLRG